MSLLERPASARCHASRLAGLAVAAKGTTYRPRSVSSLLIRLRAMVDVWVGWSGVGCAKSWFAAERAVVAESCSGEGL